MEQEVEERMNRELREFFNGEERSIFAYCEKRSEIFASELFSDDSKEKNEAKAWYKDVLEDKIIERLSHM